MIFMFQQEDFKASEVKRQKQQETIDGEFFILDFPTWACPDGRVV